MVKTYMKRIVIVILVMVFVLGVGGADSLIANGHWFIAICMVFIPLILCVVASKKGWLDNS